MVPVSFMNIIDTLCKLLYFIDFSTSFARYHTSSETNNLTKSLRGYACGEGSRAYREYFVSLSMHCTVNT